ncbi:hypothetical protein ACJRO7_023829 [Eucalyptus globulus]|uniref:Response regulatory domain-containing protein n=1 Tax=Eucalyptus globulus TaxID=34317 RepID=A0ABD3K379_EUCGL
MEEESHDENRNVWSEDRNQFPKGLKVLVVDDNVTLTKCQREEDVLLMIRENKGKFNIVLTNVHMLGMDGLQVVAKITTMGITLPVVMFSSDAEKATVVMGVNNSTCDFLIKPIQISTLKILMCLGTPHALTTSSSNNTHARAENEEMNSQSLEKSSEDEINPDHGKNRSEAKKPRIVWTFELNQMFIVAIKSLANHVKKKKKTKKILQLGRKMTSKYRTNSKKIGEASEHQSALWAHLPSFANLTRSTPPSSSPIGCGGIQRYAASAQYPSQAISIAPLQQCMDCSMRMPSLAEFPDHNTLFASPMNNTNPVLPKQSDNSVIMQMSQTPSNMQILDEHHPLHSQISTHGIQSLNSSTPHPAFEQDLLVGPSTIGAKGNESYGGNIITNFLKELGFGERCVAGED